MVAHKSYRRDFSPDEPRRDWRDDAVFCLALILGFILLHLVPEQWTRMDAPDPPAATIKKAN